LTAGWWRDVSGHAYLQGRRAFEDWTVRRRDIVSEYGLRRPRAPTGACPSRRIDLQVGDVFDRALAPDVADGGSLDDGVPRGAFLAA
ncbi:MAG TPA: hypothetical protein VI072_33820, partial [Polyangiaceae bacterium]